MHSFCSFSSFYLFISYSIFCFYLFSSSSNFCFIYISSLKVRMGRSCSSISYSLSLHSSTSSSSIITSTSISSRATHISAWFSLFTSFLTNIPPIFFSYSSQYSIFFCFLGPIYLLEYNSFIYVYLLSKSLSFYFLFSTIISN